MKKVLIFASLFTQLSYGAHQDFNHAVVLSQGIKEDNIDTVKEALRAGANVNTPSTPSSPLPLSLAIKQNPEGCSVIRILLREPILNIDKTDIFDFTPLTCAVFQFIRGESTNLDSLSNYVVDYSHPSIKTMPNAQRQLSPYMQKQKEALKQGLELPLTYIKKQESSLPPTRLKYTPFTHKIIREYLFHDTSFIDTVDYI